MRADERTIRKVTRIAAVHGVLAEHRYPQRVITDAFAAMCLPPGGDRRLLERIHAGAAVRTRHLTLPLERYAKLAGFGEANDEFIAAAVNYGAQAITQALAGAGLTPQDVDLLMYTSVTGVAAPSIDARLVTRLGLRRDVKRLPMFGLGCVGGAAGIARVHDFLRAGSDRVAVLLSVELCSLTLQLRDESVANMVASALFGDGAAAVVLVGGEGPQHSGPRVVATRSRFYPDTEQAMGWDIGDNGFRVVLGADVPDIARTYLGQDVREFLAEHGLTVDDVAAWICHPGGPKVIDAILETLGLPDKALALTRQSLARAGNLSSASVLHVLRDTLARRRPKPGSFGVLLAMGPGFCSELVLLRW